MSIVWVGVTLLSLGVLFAPVLHHLPDALYSQAHDHQNDHGCSIEAEQDPCHRKLVHHDEVAGCAHDAHLTNHTHNCQLCTVIPIRYDGCLLEKARSVVVFERGIQNTSSYRDKLVSAHIQLKGSRAPPHGKFI